jgi:hypothetical protein
MANRPLKTYSIEVLLQRHDRYHVEIEAHSIGEAMKFIEEDTSDYCNSDSLISNDEIGTTEIVEMTEVESYKGIA